MPGRALMLVMGAVVAFALGAMPVNAQDQAPRVLRGDDVVAGRSVTAWTAPYSTWLVERSKPKDCAAGQRGRMFFLYSSGGGAVRVNCTVDAGAPVMVLPAGIICWDDTRRVVARDCLTPANRDAVKQVGVKIDGVPLRIRPRDWVGRHGFRIESTPAATAGYYFVIDGLSPGRHTIALFDRVEPPGEPVFRARTIATLTVR
jgi:hypothetical protein